VRISGCHIDGFGQFERYSVEGLDHPLVVVLGPNEAGKSTLFQFMVTMLYGFSPADLTRHPYRLKDADVIGGTLAFRSGKSRCAVERRLRSTPNGILSIGSEGLFERKESIRNRPLSVTGDVSREMFESVYALTLHDMVHVSGRAWNSIQDRLLGGLNLETIRLAREVVEELEGEAKRLWRPDRRGKTEDQVLRERLRELRAEVREARERDDALRNVNRSMADIAARIQRDEDQMRLLRRTKSRAERLLPVKAQLERAEQLSQEAGDLAELECIPLDPGTRLSDLHTAASEAEREVAEMRRTIRSDETAAASFTSRDEEIVALASQIRACHSRVALSTQRRLELDRTQARLNHLLSRRNELCARLVPAGWSDDLEVVVRTISTPDVREAVRRYTRSREEADMARARREGMEMQTTRGPLVVWWAVLAVGLILMVAGLLSGQPVIWGPAVAVVTVAGGFVLQAVSLSRSVALQRGDAADGKAGAVAQAREQVIRALGGLPVSEIRSQAPDPELASDIQALQSVLAEVDAEKSTAEAIREKLIRDEAEIAQLLASAGVEASEAPESDLNRLFDSLNEVESRRVAAEQAAADLPFRRERLHELEARREELLHSHAELRERLAELGSGDHMRGIEIAGERRLAVDRAQTIQEELESGYPDLPEVVAELEQRKDELPGSREELSEIDESLDRLTRGLQEAHADLATLRANATTLGEQRSVADVESEVAVVESELQNVRIRRDRLALLAAIVRHADVRFRDRHQPDVIRRASDLVRRLTGVRYSGIEVDDQDGSLSIRDEQTGARVRVDAPLSRGTLDQIYLSLRLGLIDHLDSAGDRLPVFLDEVLVNWDSRRRKAACKLLTELAASRQIFVFTCHEWLADEIASEGGAHTVRL
jgi:uncharacterized protein YhaN